MHNCCNSTSEFNSTFNQNHGIKTVPPFSHSYLKLFMKEKTHFNSDESSLSLWKPIIYSFVISEMFNLLFIKDKGHFKKMTLGNTS